MSDHQWCGIIYYHWWTASIKPRLLFFLCKLCFPRTFPLSQIYHNSNLSKQWGGHHMKHPRSCRRPQSRGSAQSHLWRSGQTWGSPCWSLGQALVPRSIDQALPRCLTHHPESATFVIFAVGSTFENWSSGKLSFYLCFFHHKCRHTNDVHYFNHTK